METKGSLIPNWWFLRERGVQLRVQCCGTPIREHDHRVHGNHRLACTKLIAPKEKRGVKESAVQLQWFKDVKIGFTAVKCST